MPGPARIGVNQLSASHDYNLDGPDATNLPLAPDTVLQDRYRIVRQLGRGGMGAVYEALDQRLEITVALKETLSSESSMRKQFEREARLLAGMHHPALPRVSDHFVEGNRAFLVMQFIGGVDLARIISQQPGPFPRDQVIAWADQLLDALIYLHSRDRQVIHRDIKPHNLKLTATGQIALLDFGLAKAQPADASITASQAFFGYTRHYAPLEQIQDQHTDPRSDIYALGATLYHLLTGIKPPDAMVRASALVGAGSDPLKSADEIHAAVGPQIAAILNKAMAQKPEDRFADANEFREALRRMGRANDGGAVEKDSGAAHQAEARPLGRVREADGVCVQELPGTIHISAAPSSALDRALPDGRGSAWRSVPESPVVNIALVGSAKRFGPAGATAVVAILIALAAGILYGSQRWFPSPDEVSAATPANAAALNQTGSLRKVDRPRAIENTKDNTRSVDARPSNTTTVSSAERSDSGTRAGQARSRASQKRSAVAVANSDAEKKPVVAAKPQPASLRGQETSSNSQRRNSRRVGAPTIRLPSPEFRNNAPAPSPDTRVRTFGSSRVLPLRSTALSSSTPPRFFRAADGTQIVKFSDGSTRFVRPGQHSAQTSGYYR